MITNFKLSHARWSRRMVAMLLASAGLVSAAPALANAYTAIAYGSGGSSWGWATKTTQAEADKVATQMCNQGSPQKDCKVERIKAIARANGGGKVGYATSTVGLNAAVSDALKACGNAECKITFKTEEPGFFSIARPKGDGTFYVQYGGSDSDSTDQNAVALCKSKSQQDCKLVQSGSIPGKISDADTPPPEARPSTQDCRPKTSQLRCTSNCVNGNCEITYENGCKIRVQVSPQLDPFTNRWNYPSPSCHVQLR